MQKLGKNLGGYFGERIEIQTVLKEIQLLAGQHSWQLDRFLDTAAYHLPALRKTAPKSTRRVYLSTGIHGDEPAGPLAVLQLLKENPWPDWVDVWLCPCLNPTGFHLNSRENARGIDLNRQYHLDSPDAEEVKAHMDWLHRQPGFDLTLCLHEDWEAHGFYLYELNPDRYPSLAERILQQVAEVCPIDPSPTIEGRPAENGVIRPSADPRSRPQWPEAFFLITHKTRISYTLEAPSDYPLPTRVAALTAAVKAVLTASDWAPNPTNTPG